MLHILNERGFNMRRTTWRAISDRPEGTGGDTEPVDRVWVRLCRSAHAVREENMWQFAAAAADLARR